MPCDRRPTGSVLAVLALSCTVVFLSPGAAGANPSVDGPPPPLLPEPVVRALAEELSGTLARHTVQELSLHHRTRASEGFARAAEAIRKRAERYGLPEVEVIRLRASIRTRGEPGSYESVTAVIPGADPDLRRQEIVYSCHLDGANDAASGCAAILEVARALHRLIETGKIPPPRRSLRFVWPPEIEGTIALLNARPDWVARARAVIHMDRVGGREDRTRSILHVTRSPRSLPTAANDVAEAFARFVNEQSYTYAATGEADFPLVDPEGSRQALRARIADFSMGSDHQVWTEGSFRVPAIYLNDWPDRTIHTHADGVENVDPTKLLRAAFLGAASGYYLATVDEERVPALLDVVRRHGLERTATSLGRAGRLDDDEAANLLRQRVASERAIRRSIGAFAPWPAASRATMRAMDVEIEGIVRAATPEGSGDDAPDAGAAAEVCTRSRAPKGPLWGFDSSWFEDHWKETGRERPALLSYEGLRGSGSEYAYEVLNLLDGRRTVRQVRDAVAATYGPVPLDAVAGYVDALESIDLVRCGAPLGLFDMMAASTAPLAERAPRFPIPESTVDVALGGYTKVLCSAVFVSGRELEEAAQNSAFLFLRPEDRPALEDVVLDRELREVRVLRDGRVVRTARFHGDQGCISLPPGEARIAFEPVPVESSLPDAATTPWPMGDLDARIDPASLGIDPEALDAAVDLAFADPAALTQGMVVVHRGKILAERYAPGRAPDTQLESWSMGKSLGATLVGVLVEQGKLALDEPAPVPAWHEPGDPDDPRSEIRVSDLLRMSSGLEFYSHHDAEWTPELGYLEHFYVYTGGVDVVDFSTSRPARVPPGTEGRYHNSDPLTLSGIVRRVVTAGGEKPLAEYLTFPQRELFDRIGIRRQVLETDVAGNFVISGYDYGTPRNWARLGLLYLNDGLFDGERILPEGWIDFVSTPAPAWREPAYGGGFWLNRLGTFDLPADAYSMAGAGSQYVIIVPSLDLVVVRMGHLLGGGPGQAALNRSLGEIWKLLETPAGEEESTEPAPSGGDGLPKPRHARIEHFIGLKRHSVRKMNGPCSALHPDGGRSSR